jgi:HEAT repeat protein
MLWLTLRQLKSKQVAVRRRAAAALSHDPPPRAVDALAAAVLDGDAEVRRLAVEALGKLEIEERVEPLVAALRDRDAEVLKAALKALKSIHDERIAESLVPLLKNADPSVRGQTSLLLEKFTWRPKDQAEEIVFLVARGHFSRAAQKGAAAIPALEFVLQTGAYNQRVAAVEALGRIDDQRVLRPLLGALNSEDPAVCTAAINALGDIGGPQVHGPIAGLLRHGEGHVRTAAVEALAQIGGSNCAELLVPMLRDPVWDVRRAAASTLGKLKDSRAVEGLAIALDDADADVREAAAMALGNLNHRRGIGPLVKALRDSSNGVRRIAAASLARIDEDWSNSPEAQQAAEELKGGLQDKDPNVRYAVGSALSSLGVHTFETEALKPTDTPGSSPEKRRKLAVSLLLATLCDSHPALRVAAAVSLARLGDSRVEPALQRSLRDPELAVRRASEQALITLHENRRGS